MWRRSLLTLAMGVWALGCSPREAMLRQLRSDSPRTQTAAIARIAREGDASMAGYLIRLLESEDESVRFMAAAALHRLTGIDRGFHFADADRRRAIVAEWHRWWEETAGEPVPTLEPATASAETEAPAGEPGRTEAPPSEAETPERPAGERPNAQPESPAPSPNSSEKEAEAPAPTSAPRDPPSPPSPGKDGPSAHPPEAPQETPE